MRTPEISSKKVAAALAPLALAGAVMAPAAAASTSASPLGPIAAAMQAKVGASRGFHIYNDTSWPITLDNITGSGHFEGRPADGSVLNPGSYQDIEVQWIWEDPQADDAHYGAIQVLMSVDGWGYPDVLECKMPHGTCAVDGTNVTLLDPPGTVNNLPPEQKQAQANVLNQLCNAGVASCTFTPTAEDHILGDSHVVGEAAVNPGNFEMKTTIETKDSVGESDSVGVELSAGMEGIVVADVTAKYDHEWTKEHDFSQSFEVAVKPHTKVWFTHEAPTIKDTGDFKVTLGNTTWNLTGVYFEHPDLTAQAQIGAYTPHEAPASQQELAEAKAHPGQLLPMS